MLTFVISVEAVFPFLPDRNDVLRARFQILQYLTSGTFRIDVTMIDVQDFKKAYGTTLAVSGLTFRVEPTQVWGLVGHNGAGKTTTMRAISGLLPPSSGTLKIDGIDVNGDSMEARRRLAYMPDDPQLFESLTVGDHLRFTASAYQLTDYADEAAELLEYFELAAKVDTPAEDLSRGMRQKLAICCGDLQRPRAILFDEPFTGLDPLAIRRLKESISRRATAGAAVMVSSHLLAMVEDLCTHFLILSSGEPTFCGTHDELLSQHSDGATLEEIFFQATSLGNEVAEFAASSDQLARQQDVEQNKVQHV